MRNLSGRLTATGVLLAVCLIGLPAPSSAAAPSGPAQSSAQSGPPPDAKIPLPQTAADLDRIREAVGREPSFKFDDSQVRFYLQILAPKPNFSDYVKDADLLHGPVAGAQMTHREFLDMVTPKELYSSAGIRPNEALQMAITGLVGQMLVRKAFESVTDAWRARQIKEINERIDLELAALRGKGK